MPQRNLYRPTDARLKHGNGIWSGPFFASQAQGKDLNDLYASVRKKLDLKQFEKLCTSVHGYEESLTHEVTSDGYVNDLIVWVATDNRGHMGVLFPAPDEHGKVTREISFYTKGPGQAAIDSMANAFSSMFAARLARKA